MTRSECKNQILAFKIGFENYRRSLEDQSYTTSEDAHRALLESQRSQLNQTYGRLEKYVDKFGLGVSYLSALGDGTYSDVLDGVSFAIQNLDRILGRFDAISDEEFDEMMRPERVAPVTRAPESAASVRDLKHPHGEYWGWMLANAWRWIREHIFGSTIGAILIGLCIAYLTHLFGWNR